MKKSHREDVLNYIKEDERQAGIFINMIWFPSMRTYTEIFQAPVQWVERGYIYDCEQDGQLELALKTV